jgi:hypothetical protein
MVQENLHVKMNMNGVLLRYQILAVTNWSYTRLWYTFEIIKQTG